MLKYYIMRKNNLLKFNIITAALIITLSSFTSAAVIYAPGANEVATTPLNDPVLNPIENGGSVSDEAAAAISQIVIKNTNVATQVNSPVAVPQPTAAQTAAMTPNGVQPTLITNSNNLTTSSFTIKNVLGEKAPEISAPAYILINATTKHIYAAKDMNSRYEPAGLANLLTAYIATQKFSMDTILTVNGTAVKGVDKDAAIAAIDVGDTITLKDALASMFVKGCVDSANVVAENVSGSIDEFVKLMNETAKSLGCNNSYFVNPSGINNEGQQCSALDIAVVMAKCCENPELVELLSLPQYTLPAAKRRDKLLMYSKNSQLLKANSTYNADVAASRMGYNTKARYCIASLMNYSGNQIIAVVLKANGSQFSDTKKLLEYGKIACTEDLSTSQ